MMYDVGYVDLIVLIVLIMSYDDLTSYAC